MRIFRNPLWYDVFQHELNFKSFDHRYTNSRYSEKDVLPIFIMSCIYRHEPYIDAEHVLKRRFNTFGMSDRDFRCFYLYWTIAGSFKNDSMIEGYSTAGTFESLKIQPPDGFDDKYLHSWTVLILQIFFKLGPVSKQEYEYEQRNIEHLMIALNYAKAVHDECIYFNDQQIQKYYSLAMEHRILESVRDFFKGISFPTILQPYRNSKDFFENVVHLYWPDVLSTMVPFTEEEIQIVEQAQEQLHEYADFEFIIEYTNRLKHYFQDDHPFFVQMKQYLEPNNRTDAAKIKKVLSRMDPDQRRFYFGQMLPISNHQLEHFIQEVANTSFQEAFRPYLEANKKRIDFEFERTGATLCNEKTLNQLDYYCYNLEDLMFHFEDQYLYIFLPEELCQLTDHMNPYTRKELPKSLFEELVEDENTESLEDIWEKVFKRRVDLAVL